MRLKWTLSCDIPVLEQIMEQLDTINTRLAELTANQAAEQSALSEHLEAIEEEIRQLGSAPDPVDLEAVAMKIHAASELAANNADTLRAMTEQVKAMVPDAPGA